MTIKLFSDILLYTLKKCYYLLLATIKPHFARGPSKYGRVEADEGSKILVLFLICVSIEAKNSLNFFIIFFFVCNFYDFISQYRNCCTSHGKLCEYFTMSVLINRYINDLFSSQGLRNHMYFHFVVNLVER